MEESPAVLSDSEPAVTSGVDLLWGRLHRLALELSTVSFSLDSLRESFSDSQNSHTVLQSLLQETRLQVSVARIELSQIKEQLATFEQRLIACEDRLGLNSLD